MGSGLGHREDVSPSTLPRVSEHSSATGFIPAGASLLPRMHLEGNQRGVPWGVEPRLVLRPERTVFFTDNYRIIVNTQERRDVKMKLLKTFLD